MYVVQLTTTYKQKHKLPMCDVCVCVGKRGRIISAEYAVCVLPPPPPSRAVIRR